MRFEHQCATAHTHALTHVAIINCAARLIYLGVAAHPRARACRLEVGSHWSDSVGGDVGVPFFVVLFGTFVRLFLGSREATIGRPLMPNITCCVAR